MERSRPIFKAPSECMRGWAEALNEELRQWPNVNLKRSFGMILAYRKDVVFAALPGTPMLYDEDAILIKFLRESPALSKRVAGDRRFAAGTMGSGSKARGEGRKWRIFLMRSDEDALEWLTSAYEAAGKPQKR